MEYKYRIALLLTKSKKASPLTENLKISFYLLSNRIISSIVEGHVIHIGVNLQEEKLFSTIKTNSFCARDYLRVFFHSRSVMRKTIINKGRFL